MENGSDQPAPTTGPGNDGEPEISDIEAAQLDYRAAAVQLLADHFAAEPTMAAVNASHVLLIETVGVLAGVTHPPVVRAAMLMALMDTYPETPDFIEIGKLKQAIDAAVTRRRGRDTTTKGGIILPGKD